MLTKNREAIKIRLLEIELQEAFAFYRTQFSLLIQFIAGVVAANVAYVGYVFATGKIELLMVGAIFPLGLLVALSRAHKVMMPILFSALSLEDMNLGHNTGVIYDYLFYMQGEDYVARLLSLRKVKDLDKRRRELVKVALPIGHRGLIRFSIFLAAIAQFIIGVLYLYLQ